MNDCYFTERTSFTYILSYLLFTARGVSGKVQHKMKTIHRLAVQLASFLLIISRLYLIFNR